MGSEVGEAMDEQNRFRFSLANLMWTMAPVAVVVTICRLPLSTVPSPDGILMIGVKILSVALGLPAALGALIDGPPGMARAFLGMLGLYGLILVFMLVLGFVAVVFLLIVGTLARLN